MINLLEGVPGSGKSYEAVVYHVLPALQSGRKVITNLPLIYSAFQMLYPDLVHLLELRKTTMPILGKWDPEAANRGEFAFVLGDFSATVDPEKTYGLQLSVDESELLSMPDGTRYLPAPSNVPLFGSVWDFYTDWRGKNGIGPLFVIDECHVSFPKPKRNKPKGTPEEVIEWFKLSRHFGADVLLMTQRMGALEEDISGLAEFHIRVRKAAFLGKPDHYIRRVFAGFKGGEVACDEREYMPQYFPLYKSHTQGQTVIENRDSDVTPAHLKWRRRGFVCMFIGFAGVAWIVGGLFIGNDKPKSKPATQMQPIAMGSAHSQSLGEPSKPLPAVPVVAQDSKPAPVVSSPAPVDPDPLETRLIHMTGCVLRLDTGEEICTFTVSQNGLRVFDLTSAELRDIGYEFKRLGHCASVIKWKNGSSRPIICDSPSVSPGVLPKVS